METCLRGENQQHQIRYTPPKQGADGKNRNPNKRPYRRRIRLKAGYLDAKISFVPHPATASHNFVTEKTILIETYSNVLTFIKRKYLNYELIGQRQADGGVRQGRAK
ncbi:MAG: hypothetical protein WAN43_13120 [Rhodomicrobium sp.]